MLEAFMPLVCVFQKRSYPAWSADNLEQIVLIKVQSRQWVTGSDSLSHPLCTTHDPSV